MTKKDYKIIARAIATRPNVEKRLGYPEKILRWDLVRKLCEVFAKENPHFDRELFIGASYVNEKENK